MSLLWVLPAQAEPDEPARLTQAPALRTFVEAEYPEALAEARVEGSVTLQIDVDETGLVQRVEVVDSSTAAFDEPALSAACGFVFSPAIAGALGPVPVRINFKYEFVLKATDTSTDAAPPIERPAARAPPINFSGRLREAGARSALGFATVYIESTTTSTDGQPVLVRTATEADERGEFALRGVPPGRLRVMIRSEYFEPFDTREVLRAGEAIEAIYYLERASRNPYEVVVRAKRPKKEVARRTLTMEEIQLIPGAQGDVLRVLQNMPGVARSPFGLGLLVVRGAPPQDTGVFLDGHRLPILFHFGGIGGVTSVVNSRIVDKLSFFPGGFSPRLGRVSAGAVEIESRNAATDRVHGEAQLEMFALVPVTASVFLEGPVSKGNPEYGSFVMSLRRSSVDGVFTLASEVLGSSFAIAPRFFDYQARYDLPLGDRSRMLSVFAYGSDDELVVVGADSIGADSSSPTGSQSRTFFHRLNPSFTYQKGDTFFRVSPIIGVDFTNTETDSGANDNANNFRFRLDRFVAGMRVDASTRVSPWLLANIGGDVDFQQNVTSAEVPVIAPVKDFPSPVGTDRPTRRDEAEAPATGTSLYGELEFQLLDERLKIWPGVRLDAYDLRASLGDNVDDRLVEGRTLFGVDPRLTVRFDQTPRFAMKGQAGVYRQPPLPFQLFLNPDLPLQTGYQVSGGVEYEIIENLSLDLQGFYRFTDDVPIGTGDRVVVDGEIRALGVVPEAEQQAYGLEVFLKLEKRWGLFGWVAYTLSRSESRREGNEWRQNFIFDQTHNLNIVASYDLGLNWSVGLRFRYVTGGVLPATDERFWDSDLDQYRRTLGDSERAPPFNQLDILIKKRWVFDEWYFEAYLDIQNVYNYTNTEFYLQTFDFKNTVPFPGLPFFPSLGFKGVF